MHFEWKFDSLTSNYLILNGFLNQNRIDVDCRFWNFGNRLTAIERERERASQKKHRCLHLTGLKVEDWLLKQIQERLITQLDYLINWGSSRVINFITIHFVRNRNRSQPPAGGRWLWMNFEFEPACKSVLLINLRSRFKALSWRFY